MAKPSALIGAQERYHNNTLGIVDRRGKQQGHASVPELLFAGSIPAEGLMVESFAEAVRLLLHHGC